jgi:hypothetical protein
MRMMQTSGSFHLRERVIRPGEMPQPEVVASSPAGNLSPMPLNWFTNGRDRPLYNASQCTKMENN